MGRQEKIEITLEDAADSGSVVTILNGFNAVDVNAEGNKITCTLSCVFVDGIKEAGKQGAYKFSLEEK